VPAHFVLVGGVLILIQMYGPEVFTFWSKRRMARRCSHSDRLFYRAELTVEYILPVQNS